MNQVVPSACATHTGRRLGEQTMLQPGSEAPDFEVEDQTGRRVRLSDYRTRPVVLWFYSDADAPGSVTEGCGFRDRISRFDARGVQVFGVSSDTPARSAAFAGELRLNFPLLCDTDRAVAAAYGACNEASVHGGRAISWVIGPDGRIVTAFPKVEGKAQAEQVLQVL